MDSGQRAGSSSVTPLSVVGSVQGQTISPASLLRSSNGSPSTLAFPSLTSPRSSFSTDLSMLGNLNSAGNAGTFTGVNSVLANNSSGLALAGPVSNSGHGVAQRSLTVGAESLGFTGLPTLPSFTSNNLAGTGLMLNSLSRHGSSTRLDHQELQQLNAVSMPQYSQDSQQIVQHQQLEQHQQIQHQQQGQQLGHSHLRNQQSLGLGAQQQLQGLAAVKLEQQLIQQQGQALSSVKMETQTGSPLRQQSVQGLTPVKLEQGDASLCQQLQHQQAQTLASQALAPAKLEQVDASLRQQMQHRQAQALQGVGPVKLDVRQHEQSLHPQLSLPKLEGKPDVDLPNSLVQQSLLTLHMQRQEALQLQRQQSHMQQRILQHRSQLQQQQLQQHLRQQLAGPSKQLVFEPGICARRLMQYMFNQRQRPQACSFYQGLLMKGTCVQF